MKLPEMQILPESRGSGVKMLLLNQFFYYGGRIDIMCSEEYSTVRGQGSRIRGQGSGVKIGVTSWLNLKKSSK